MLKKQLIHVNDISKYLYTNYDWKKSFHSFLSKRGNIKTINLNHKLKNLPRILFQDLERNPGQVSEWDIAFSLRKLPIFTGYHLVSMLGWTEYLPKTIHVSFIRRVIPQIVPRSIDPEALQRVAFQPRRQSRDHFMYNGMKIHMLSGHILTNEQVENHLVQIQKEYEIAPYVKMFCEERLVIEMLMSYQYFGGADIVWDMLLEQLSAVNIEKLQLIFQEMHLSYPYQNALAYCLYCIDPDHPGLDFFENRVDHNLRFHLFLGDKERRKYFDRWSLYVPKRFYRGK